jgi:hypothetical protein
MNPDATASNILAWSATSSMPADGQGRQIRLADNVLGAWPHFYAEEKGIPGTAANLAVEAAAQWP